VHTKIDDTLKRRSDIAKMRANTDKASKVLDWRATSRMAAVVKQMIDAERAFRDERHGR
jgi:GDP-D-mannose dehydratase